MPKRMRRAAAREISEAQGSTLLDAGVGIDASRQPPLMHRSRKEGRQHGGLLAEHHLGFGQ